MIAEVRLSVRRPPLLDGFRARGRYEEKRDDRQSCFILPGLSTVAVEQFETREP
jgi:hypothetical protein